MSLTGVSGSWTGMGELMGVSMASEKGKND